ncbi:hypothetical protein DTO002I6_4622 [Penicillium roqueforti]|nr:hypothetical protein DTO002I6_4622 [Penicillium roqueforti]
MAASQSSGMQYLSPKANNCACNRRADIDNSGILVQHLFNDGNRFIRHLRKKTQGKPVAQREAVASESSTESEDPNASELLKELVKLRKEIRQRDELHKEELQKVKEEFTALKEEFSAALAEVRHELQTLADRPATPQPHPESCSPNNHDAILREIQSLREEISAPAPTSSPSYADVARTPPTSYSSNIRTLSTLNTTPNTFTETLYCTIDTSKMTESENERKSAGSIRATIEKEVRTMDDHTHWRYRAVTVSPRDPNRIRIACRDEAEYQLVKKVAEEKIGTGARVLRDELYPLKVDSVKKSVVLDKNHDILAGAAAALGEENETTVARITWLSSKEAAKLYRSMVVYLTKGSNARRLLADRYFHVRGESGTTSVFEYRPRPMQYYNCQEIGHKVFQCKKTQKYAKCATEGHHYSRCDQEVLKYSVYLNSKSETIAIREAVGSPLSPILFLFFNADLVQRQIDSQGGTVAFVDDFTAWVTGPTAQSNREGIEAIINEALDWERRSGATFKAEKTAIIHFAPKMRKSDHESFIIKGQTVVPKDHVKILGLLMDTRLKYKEHIARAASKGLEAAMGLRRLRGLSPATARQLFTLTVAPVVDYASNVWMHACKDKAMGPINRVQRVGAQAIVGTFLTVATSVAEAEAHIATARHRFWRRAVKMWTDMHTLPETNPLRRGTDRIRKFRRYHRSPLYHVADALKHVDLETLETINPFTFAPWDERV